jgi:transcriptional regulator with XRE-family HTH domain
MDNNVTALRRLRLKKGATQREMALLCNVTERTYVRWEQGERLPDAANLIRIADYFGVNPRALVPAA